MDIFIYSIYLEKYICALSDITVEGHANRFFFFNNVSR